MGEDRVPVGIRKILDWDVRATKNAVDWAFTKYPSSTSSNAKAYMKILEISCHGIPWFAITMISIYLIPSAREFQVNLLMGLILDVILVALTKAISRRNRPSVSNDMFFTHGPDKFSFPSGHASRSVLLLLFLTHTIIDSMIILPILYLWVVAVCISRVLLRRHHLLDVAFGVIYGVIEFYILWILLWASQSTSRTIGNWIAGL
ncbi:unnamed protein product [Orchesella dallaii]|uniref:Phosphatidic acid phosphatase type 2/haloperoxidase domain-containing protein n=1 Tax=Orchesella dallaii TaxID=48710 RepID=A0ABP1R0Z2_9HEXA